VDHYATDHDTLEATVGLTDLSVYRCL